ncbi:DUF559 domain-containing protein [Agromyces mariniharenae]|uniref:DUF559 domain-containing protein n=1 Tax=Agromyces mariniharenae TaxID=2604423 RepID=A0A5S4V8K8_9MICO|nr:DUF559 domain-containing protein [Agromyces mariniharenae]TYL54379.1 DUF559 domain-containing protein [Agromyces mariniharenae]
MEDRTESPSASCTTSECLRSRRGLRWMRPVLNSPAMHAAVTGSRRCTALRIDERNASTMELERWAGARSGVVHQHDAIRAGFTRYAVRRGLERGQLRRIRGPWLATADASPSLVRAARIGGRLACVSATRHHGLWTLDDATIHVAVPPHSSRHQADGAVLHWSEGPMATHPYELVEPVVNALMHVADCRPFDEAVAVWESALNSRRVSAGMLARLPMRSAAARLVRSTSTTLSDSGIESIPVVRLARIGIVARQQVVLDGHPVDLLIGERLVVQIDGFESHRRAVQRERDLAQDRRLRLLGFTVFRYGYRQVLTEWDTVESEIRLAVAQGLHVAG